MWDGIPLAILLSAVLADFAPQQAGSEPLTPALEGRVQKLGKQRRWRAPNWTKFAPSSPRARATRRFGATSSSGMANGFCCNLKRMESIGWFGWARWFFC